ncbi:MAG: DUF4157 domain-containing protein [Pyrinomonadaceae bacterium]
MNAPLQTQAKAVQQTRIEVPLKSLPVLMMQPKCALSESGRKNEDAEDCGKTQLSLLRAQQKRDVQVPNPGSVPPIVHDVLGSAGRLLDDPTRSFFEPRFGHDFRKVRVHTGTQATQSARDVGALAYTVGSDIVFEQGQYAPGNEAGKKLLAHELAHVVQQSGHLSAGRRQLQINQPADQFEQEADRAANEVMDGRVRREHPISGAEASGNRKEESRAVSQRGKDESGIGSRTGRATVEEWQATSVLKAPMLQRSAKFVAGTVDPANNIAVQIATGGDAGTTWMTLNGHALETEPDAWEAVNKPVIGGLSKPSESECWVDSVADNVGSFQMTVPNNGPWETVTTKANLWDKLGLGQCFNEQGNAKLTVKGKPSDAAVATATRVHEDRHATDDEKVFNSTILKWDSKLTMAQLIQEKFKGHDHFDCESNLYFAMGGTPEEIAQRFRDQGLFAGVNFHQTAAGGKLKSSDPSADPDCKEAKQEVGY